MKSKTLRRTLAIAMSAATLLTSAVSLNAFAANDNEAVQAASEAEVTYVENHSVIDCANYYIDGASYRFLIKIPKGASLSCVTVKDVYVPGEVKLSDITNSPYNCLSVYYQYSDSTSDYYMYSLARNKMGAPKYSWYYYGIKLFYDNGDEHYMATNTSNGSTVEGPGYRLEM